MNRKSFLVAAPSLSKKPARTYLPLPPSVALTHARAPTACAAGALSVYISLSTRNDINTEDKSTPFFDNGTVLWDGLGLAFLCVIVVVT